MKSRDEILSSLKGTTVTIPNLYSIFTGWKDAEINPCYEGLVPVANERLQR
jgi:hypothetical protein